MNLKPPVTLGPVGLNARARKGQVLSAIGVLPSSLWASYGQMRLDGLSAALLLLVLLVLLAWVVLALWCRWFRHGLLAWPTSLLGGLWWALLLGQWSDLQALLRWTPDLLALLLLLGIAAGGLFVLLAPAMQARQASAHDHPGPRVGPPVEDGALPLGSSESAGVDRRNDLPA